MSEYVPTLDEAFEATLYTWLDWKPRFTSEEDARAGWDRMMAAHDAEVAAKSLEQFADAQDSWCEQGRADQVISREAMRDALRARAAEYRKAVESE